MHIGNTRDSIRTQQHAGHASPPTPTKYGEANHVDGTTASQDIELVDRLKTLITNSMQIRESVVADVTKKVQEEDYLTREVAIATARSILNA